MTTAKEWAEAFTIFAKYDEKDFYVSAEHEIIYAGWNGKPEELTETDIKELETLGWYWDESLETFYTYT